MASEREIRHIHPHYLHHDNFPQLFSNSSSGENSNASF